MYMYLHFCIFDVHVLCHQRLIILEHDSNVCMHVLYVHILLLQVCMYVHVHVHLLVGHTKGECFFWGGGDFLSPPWQAHVHVDVHLFVGLAHYLQYMYNVHVHE